MKFYLNPLTKAVRNGLGAAMVISLAAAPTAALAQDAAEDAEETASASSRRVEDTAMPRSHPPEPAQK